MKCRQQSENKRENIARERERERTERDVTYTARWPNFDPGQAKLFARLLVQKSSYGF